MCFVHICRSTKKTGEFCWSPKTQDVGSKSWHFLDPLSIFGLTNQGRMVRREASTDTAPTIFFSTFPDASVRISQTESWVWFRKMQTTTLSSHHFLNSVERRDICEINGRIDILGFNSSGMSRAKFSIIGHTWLQHHLKSGRVSLLLHAVLHIHNSWSSTDLSFLAFS